MANEAEGEAVHAAAGSAALAGHDNNFGLLRLMLATLVIVGHAPPLTEGAVPGGVASRIVRGIAPHELAVDGFFLLSGYLITASAFRSTVPSYLRKRVARIYPGFAVAYIVSLAIAWWAGGSFDHTAPVEMVRHAVNILRLAQPNMVEPFRGNPFTVVNGSLWTCSYEFCCYLLVLLLYRLGVVRRGPWLVLMVAALLVAGTIAAASPVWIVHKLYNPARLAALFLTGSIFKVWQGAIRYDGRVALLGLAGLGAALCSPWTSLAGVAVCGGYVLFWAGFARGPALVRRIGQTTDISYGVYLYAWPIQSLIIWCDHGIGPWLGAALATPPAYGAGLLSWLLVEKHFLGRNGDRSLPPFLRDAPRREI